MPITDIFGRMPLEKIWVKRKERQRKNPDPEKGGLLQSIALRGVLVPIIIEQEVDANGYHVLYAGERRYTASNMLGLPDIPFRFAHEPTESEIKIIELEENIKREDLTWQEMCEAVVELHGVLKGENPAQTFLATGETLGWSDGSSVAKYHMIYENWQDEAVQRCGTVNEAINLLMRRQKRAQANKLEEWLGEAREEEKEDGTSRNDSGDSDIGACAGDTGYAVCSAGPDGIPPARIGHNASTAAAVPRSPAPQSPAQSRSAVLPIIEEDFLRWAPTYTGGKFNLIHCDFPYGIKFGVSTHRSGSNSLSREEGEVYYDGQEYYQALLETFVGHFDRFASESCHVMFWYSNREEVEVLTRAALKKIPGFTFLRFPLVWHKSDNAGFITPGNPRHVYETCLVGGRGDRPIVKYVSDAYSSASDNSLHMSAKPEPMLRYFMGMLVDEHSRVFDPTAGSGSALRAAESLKAERVFGLETNPEMVRVANKALLEARAKRAAEERMKEK